MPILVATALVAFIAYRGEDPRLDLAIRVAPPFDRTIEEIFDDEERNDA